MIERRLPLIDDTLTRPSTLTPEQRQRNRDGIAACRAELRDAVARRPEPGLAPTPYIAAPAAPAPREADDPFGWVA